MTKHTRKILGKTIQSIRKPTINKWKILFTDGSSIELWAEPTGPFGFSELWVNKFKPGIQVS